MVTARPILLVSLAMLVGGCPKPPPDPVPADKCDKPGQACADEPAPEGPPPVGSQVPPRS